MQRAVIEYARNVCGWDSAKTAPEFDASTEYPIIDIMPDPKDIENMGGNNATWKICLQVN